MSETRTQPAVSDPLRTSMASWRWTAVPVLAISTFLASLARVGADYDWLVAIGDFIRATGSIPDHVPFAAAPTDGWRDVPVLAQLLASVLEPLGASAVIWLHVSLVAAALATVAFAARQSAGSDVMTAWCIALVFAGGVTAFAVARLQSLSYLPFALLVALLMAECRRPSRKIWWAPLLVAVWGNLHGAVLLGVSVLGAYLLFSRLRQRAGESVAVGAASLFALLLTPQGWKTPAYYLSALDNEAAASGEGMWGRPEMGNPLDIALVATSALLLVLTLRRRRSLWAYVAVLGLAVATVVAARNGVWLLLLLGALAPQAPSTQRAHPSSRLVATLVIATMVITAPVLAIRSRNQGPDGPNGIQSALVSAVAASTPDDGVVLAPARLAEALAVAGVTVWVSNPLDAFDAEDQRTYLDFLEGRPGMEEALPEVDVVVTEDGSRAAVRMEAQDGWEHLECSVGWTCHVRSLD